MEQRFFIFISCAILAICACSSNDELIIDGQRKEIVKLEKELAACIKLTDTARLAAEKCGVSLSDVELQKEREEAYQKLLDIAASKIPSTIKTPDLTFVLSHIERAAVWRYDRAPGGKLNQMVAPSDKQYVVVDYEIRALDPNLRLPRLAAFQATREGPVFLGFLKTEFFKWNTYDGYLGTEKDTENDFSGKGRVKLTGGVEVSKEALDRGAVIIGARFPGCLVRQEHNLSNPAVSYGDKECEKPASDYTLFNDMLPLALLK